MNLCINQKNKKLEKKIVYSKSFKSNQLIYLLILCIIKKNKEK